MPKLSSSTCVRNKIIKIFKTCRISSAVYISFSRATKSSLTKIRKGYFFRCNNISSHGYFSFFNISFCIAFMRTEKRHVKVIDDDICNRKIEFKAKSEIMKMNRKVDKKIWRVVKCKEIVELRDFFYKV